MKNKKAVSSVVTTVLIILVAIVAIALIWAAISVFLNTFKNSSSSGLLSTTKFTISPLSSDDVLFDRFRIKNTGQSTLTSYLVTVDGVRQDLVVQKIIAPGEDKYLYFTKTFAPGDHNLVVNVNGYVQSTTFNVPASGNYYVFITNATVT